ncbi:hypothetical protein V6N13_146813 [Hibiscus sabdariffa]|uniref:Uncharacterized protein n=1 Tax=Hibiscus sabdariffa TaxID=183260 RepID=A0ABR2TUA9_9ROSI
MFHFSASHVPSHPISPFVQCRQIGQQNKVTSVSWLQLYMLTWKQSGYQAMMEQAVIHMDLVGSKGRSWINLKPSSSRAKRPFLHKPDPQKFNIQAET